MTSPTPFSEQTQHDKDSGGNAGRDISGKPALSPVSLAAQASPAGSPANSVTAKNSLPAWKACMRAKQCIWRRSPKAGAMGSSA